ncbi:PQQ-binding-like beta-propeller repeat protein [Halosimplex sp. TS25]|uniref:PQQ-binding-like beta-propeller repeat protein n=1 Tax=Halosimplex rarum TaxID=3396619 RepID=UPI0039EC0E6F
MERSLRRRSLLRAAGAVGAAALAGCPAGIGESTEFEPGETDWPSYRFDARNTAVHPTAPGPGGDLSVAWTARFRADAGGEFADVGTAGHPIVLDGTVVAAAYDFTGEVQLTVVSAFDLSSGERQWERTFQVGEADAENGIEPARTLGSDGERVFVETLSDGPTLTALSPESGETEWAHPLDRPIASPIVTDAGSVLAGERLYASYDPADGTRQSRYETGDGRYWRSRFPPTVTEDAIYAPAFDELHAVDRESGERRWTATNDFYSILYQQEGAPFHPPVVADGVAYAIAGYIDNADTGGMVAVDTEDGSVLWTAIPEGATGSDYEGRDIRTKQAALYGMPLVLDGAVYAHGYERGEWGFFAIDPEDGSVERMGTPGGLVASQGLLYGLAGSDVTRVNAVDPAADEVVGTATVEEWDPVAGGGHAVAGEYLLVTTTQGVAVFGPE